MGVTMMIVFTLENYNENKWNTAIARMDTTETLNSHNLNDSALNQAWCQKLYFINKEILFVL